MNDVLVAPQLRVLTAESSREDLNAESETLIKYRELLQRELGRVKARLSEVAAAK